MIYRPKPVKLNITDIKRPTRRPEIPKPPRVLLCHCKKCDDRWTVRMELIPDPEPPKELPKRGRFRGDRQRRMVWIFPPDGFEACESCGSKMVDSIHAHTDELGRVKLKYAGV